MTFLKVERIPLKILIPVVAVITTIAIAYVTIILLDPYYGPCQYVYSGVQPTKCYDNNAWHVQQWINDEIHKIIPYAVAQTDNGTAGLNMTQYKDSLGRFSILYPTNWTATPATNRFETNALTIHNDNPRTALVLVEIQLSTLPLETYATAFQNAMYGWSVFQDTECLKYKINGNTACSFIMTKSEDTLTGTPSLTTLIVVTAMSGKAYVISMGSPSDNFDSVLPTYDKMI